MVSVALFQVNQARACVWLNHRYREQARSHTLIFNGHKSYAYTVGASLLAMTVCQLTLF